MKAKEYLRRIVYRRSEIDRWIAGSYPFSVYDSDVGYIHRDRRCREGIGGSLCTYTYDRGSGARTMVNHASAACRINTYGDSYTNCEQVNDGETWQELLAARIGEPLRNFGVGGQSVYQMYLRMRREEMRFPAKYIILNIYCDDPFRSLVPWQRIRVNWWGTSHTGPPQPYIRANPVTKEFREFKNPCPHPNDLYDFCNLDWVHEHFKDDFILRIMLAKANAEAGTPEDSYMDIETLAEEYGVRTKIRTSRKLLDVANSLYRDSAVYGGMRLVEKTEDFARANDKQVLFISSYTTFTVADKISRGHEPRLPEVRRPGHSFDEDFVRFMKRRGKRYVDLMEAHLADYSRKRVTVPEYLREFWTVPTEAVTHYAPAGNQFTAAGVIDKLVDMLVPKPPAYLPGSPEKWDTCVTLDQDRS
ncbi:MAG: hypothetical protein OK474_10550 [Thaumarchaeota archaeon]|nr:hypothetical protein [Nitrososphaerota archaeon]